MLPYACVHVQVDLPHGSQAGGLTTYSLTYTYLRTYRWTYPTGLKQLVHGTYMTKATWLIKTESGRSLSVVVDAMKGEAVRIDVGPSAAELAGAVAQGLAPPAASSVRMANWEEYTYACTCA